VWARGWKDIRFSNFEITRRQLPTLFVVMQFTDQFNELYEDVVKPVAGQAGLEVVRADEIEGPGLIISDIERQVLEAQIVLADITPKNPNVYWEVGYAHAKGKPTILVAEHGTQLPFDVSGFRALFYENTIAGKSKIEDGLRRHISSILEGRLA
jgi:hypothetical protein